MRRGDSGNTSKFWLSALYEPSWEPSSMQCASAWYFHWCPGGWSWWGPQLAAQLALLLGPVQYSTVQYSTVHFCSALLILHILQPPAPSLASNQHQGGPGITSPWLPSVSDGAKNFLSVFFKTFFDCMTILPSAEIRYSNYMFFWCNTLTV